MKNSNLSKVEKNDEKEFESFLEKIFDQGLFEEVILMAQKNLERYKNNSQLNYLLAASYIQSGQERLSFPYAFKAFEISPNNVNYIYLLSYLYVQIGLYEQAMPLLDKVTKSKLSRNQFQGHDLFARLYFEIGNAEKAIKHCKLAINLAPNSDIAKKLKMKLAQFYLFANRIEEGFDTIKQITDTSSSLPFKALWLAAAFDKQGLKSVYFRDLKLMLESNRLSDDEAIESFLLLGRMHEKEKQYRDAFASWSKARYISKKKPALQRNYDEISSAHKAFYNLDLYQKIDSYRHDSQLPIFIVGMPRSGTTLTEQILSSHSKVGGAGELARFNRVEAAFRAEYSQEGGIERLLENAKMGELRERAQETIAILQLVAGDQHKRIVEKTPHHFESIGFQNVCFKNAKFIHCRRNPLDTFISSFQNDMNVSHAYAYDQLTYLNEYLWQESMMNYWKSLFPDSIFTIHYEELASNPEQISKQLISFSGLAWEDACLKFFERKNVVRTFSVQQVRNPVYNSSVKKWTHYRSELTPMIDTLRELNYSYPDLDLH